MKLPVMPPVSPMLAKLAREMPPPEGMHTYRFVLAGPTEKQPKSAVIASVAL